MNLQIGTVDGLVNITPKAIYCFVNAINAFSKGGVEYAREANVSFGMAFQRFVEPVYTGIKEDFDLKDIFKPAYTTNNKEQSPARVTFCKKMGLLKIDDSNDVFELTPLAEEIRLKRITIEEYAFILLTKQGIFIDGNYVCNLFSLIAQRFEESTTISDIEILDYIKEKFEDADIEKTRADIIINALCTTGLIAKITKGVYVLSNTLYAEIFKDFQDKSYLLSPAYIDKDDAYIEYMGEMKYGIFDVINNDNKDIYLRKFPNLIKYVNLNKDIMNKENISQMPINAPLQQIFYGAPGTGKSHTIKRETKGRSVVRTTFHPDSDYSTFVGAYKPTMDDVDTKVVPVVVNNGISLVNAGTYKEKKIVYKFIPQAFLKAYLGAWKKFADRATRTSVPLAHTFKINDGEYTITGVNTNDISFHRVFPFNISHSSVGRAWNEIWATGSFVIPTGAQPGVSVQQAIAQWIYDNVQNCTKQSLEEGLETLKKSIEEKGQVPISRSSQTYTLSKKENGYFIDTDGKCSKTKIQDYYNGNEPKSGARGLQRYFANLLKDIDSSSFENAWTRLADAVNKNTDKVDLQAAKSVLEPQFLVIEEINRGNCAQIFGDLFQLLDRGDNGFSEYPIEADSDLQQEIERAFKENKDYKLNGNIDIEGVIEGYTSNYGATLSEDVQSGRVLLLPNNLYIWATMNTSDQSLFPIDSAFKRRWDWKYIKIKNHPEENYQIVIGEEAPISWWDFIEKINDIIASMTSSADKQLGYFFCKADKDDNISAETFVSKVIFYLWNDVFKDYGFEDTSLFRYVDEKDGKEKDLTFPDFYEEDGEEVNETRLKDFLDKVMNWKKDKE